MPKQELAEMKLKQDGTGRHARRNVIPFPASTSKSTSKYAERNARRRQAYRERQEFENEFMLGWGICTAIPLVAYGAYKLYEMITG